MAGEHRRTPPPSAGFHHDALRTTEGWNNLAHLTAQVERKTRSSIGVEPDVPLHLDRSDVTAALSASVAETTAGALVVVGPSGSGKPSSLLTVLRSGIGGGEEPDAQMSVSS